jgi:hypothetical protein
MDGDSCHSTLPPLAPNGDPRLERGAAMTSRTTGEGRKADRETIVWIGHRKALIIGREDYDRRTVQVLERGPAETETAFERRAVDEVVDDERVTVAGPVNARTQFERALLQ